MAACPIRWGALHRKFLNSAALEGLRTPDDHDWLQISFAIELKMMNGHNNMTERPMKVEDLPLFSFIHSPFPFFVFLFLFLFLSLPVSIFRPLYLVFQMTLKLYK